MPVVAGRRVRVALAVVLLSIAFAGLCAPLATSALLASGAPPGDGSTQARADATRVLDAARKFYGSLRGLQAKSTASVESSALSGKVEVQLEVGAERPNLLAVRTTVGAGSGDVVCDGKKLYLSMPALRRYTLLGAPGTFGQLSEQLPTLVPGLDILLGLLTGRALGDSGAAYIHLGMEQVAGAICHHLQQMGPGGQMDVWVEDGAQPWLRRCLRVQQGRAAGRNGRSGQSARVDSTSTVRAAVLQEFTDWSNTPPPRATFTIKPALGLNKADTLYPTAEEMKALMRGAAGGDAEARPHPSEGLPAKPFRLEQLGGGTVDLSQHLGKDVIVLDFWATWCRPCVIAMPLVEHVAERFRPQGVVFYAIDLREGTERVASFVRDRHVSLRVALDPRGEVGDLYGVAGIPHTTVIDRSGRVAHVHIGFREDLEDVLGAELQALLAQPAAGHRPADKPAHNPAGGGQP